MTTEARCPGGLDTFISKRLALATGSGKAFGRAVHARYCADCKGFHYVFTEATPSPTPAANEATPSDRPPPMPSKIVRKRCQFTGLVSYSGPNEAKSSALRGARGRRARPFRCDDCGQWHVTSDVAEGGRGRGFGANRRRMRPA